MLRVLVICFGLCASHAAPAAPVEVDVELVLAVDVSRSMTTAELDIQRRGYAEALTSPPVLAAIGSGMLGRVAVTYVEWAGSGAQRVIVPWTLIATPKDAHALAEKLLFGVSQNMRHTSITGALRFASDAFDDNGFEGLRRIIDISGDGPNNQGGPVVLARDQALARGIIINGLPLMTSEGAGFRWHIDNLDQYYEDCVIGGPGSFALPVTDWTQFAAAVRRKLVLELAGAPERIFRIQARAPADCLIGEKIWQQRQRMFDEP